MKINITFPENCSIENLQRVIAKEIHTDARFVQEHRKEINVSMDFYNKFCFSMHDSKKSYLLTSVWDESGFGIDHSFRGGEIEIPDILPEQYQKEQEYEQFKLQWMLSHGYTLCDLITALSEYQQDGYEDASIDHIFADWEFGCGFGSEIWPCFDEYLDSEDKMDKVSDTNISPDCIKKSEQVLVDNGISPDEAQTVLQAIGYTLLDKELYPNKEEKIITYAKSNWVRLFCDTTDGKKLAKERMRINHIVELAKDGIHCNGLLEEKNLLIARNAAGFLMDDEDIQEMDFISQLAALEYDSYVKISDFDETYPCLLMFNGLDKILEKFNISCFAYGDRDGLDMFFYIARNGCFKEYAGPRTFLTKEKLREKLSDGELLTHLIETCSGQECEIVKADAFYPGDEIIYIPDLQMNGIPMTKPVTSPAEIEELLSSCYTADDFIEICEGNKELAKRLFFYCDWQHPSSALPELYDDDEE